ncbi:MAG: HAD family hydrolase [Deltaproteobacteria bacterium]|nr:HAD family hydrolase [Deltaproteobacteria bacterium]
MTAAGLPIHAVIFDYDGTLVHLNIDFGSMRQGVEELLIDYGIEPHSLKGSYVLEMINEATDRIATKASPEGSAFHHKALELVTEYEVKAAKNGKKLPGMLGMLRLLRERGIKIGVITRNCDKAVKMVFPDIERYSDVYLPRDYVTNVKPHLDHLALALEEMGVRDPAICLMVGDHLMDIEGGKRMGMKTAGVLTGKITHQEFIEAGADYILEDVTVVTGIIFGEEVS